MEGLLARIPWGLAVVACLTLGLAPFTPPHLYEKLRMLYEGRPLRAIDWFDLALHAAPWVLLALKAVYFLRKAPQG